MKTLTGKIFGLAFLAAFFFGATLVLSAQTNTSRHASPEYSNIPMFTNNPAAMYVITNLLQEPMPELAVPEISQTGGSYGTFWMLKGEPVPWPYNPYADLPAYQVSTNEFIIDDRSVDYPALETMVAMEAAAYAATNPPVFTACQSCEWSDHGLLWLEASNSLATADYFTVALHNTVQGQSYDVMTTADLAASFSMELVVTGAVGTVTSVQIPTNNRTNLFVRARTSANYSFYLVTLPLSQDVLAGDTVTFYVETGGNTNLTFQWTLNGNAIVGATNSSYTIYNVRPGDAGDYACIISDGTHSFVTAAGTLTVENGTGDLNQMAIVSDRQNYTFKSGVTYYLGSQFRFYGNTTIEAGAVIKPDWYYNAGLVIMGNLICKGEPYYPAVITSVDDDSIGVGLGFSGDDGPPQPNITGVPYLELACCKTNSISNLRIAYADYGVTTPTDLQRLDVWNCQFVQCNYGVVNLVAADSTNTLHNVLFAACGAAIGAATNAITVEAEQVTADVSDFCLAYATPARMDLKNSLIWGNTPTATTFSSLSVVLNPDATNFVSSGAGYYYLAANSPLHHSGWTGISSRLQAELKNKTTYPPLAIEPFTTISGQITLSPQAQRYTNGTPDIGFYYDALDYTVAGLALNGGTLNVLPGTAVGLRMEYVSAYQNWTYGAFVLGNNSTFNAQGRPDKPCVVVDIQQVQEQFQWPVMVAFVPNYLPVNNGDGPPTMNFRFANFYLGYASYVSAPQYHFWSGISLYGYEWSLDSAMNFALQDCQVRGGQIDIGTPDNPDTGFGILDYDTLLGSGEVKWNNNLFDGVNINLNPTYYWMIGTNNCDLQVSAYNNLFKNSAWLIISGTPASAGNWTFRDNLFDKVQFFQDPALPLDFDHNGYWPLSTNELIFGASGYTNRLQATATSDGSMEVFLTNAPSYRGGAFGNYYLTQTNSLYQAGSRTADDAGLTQYTSLVNQAKDASGQPVNIGLHYVAATNSLPRDTDSDGVPDYVEAEHGTDLNNAMSDGVTNDTYNAAYDDVDLSGNGLVGRIKKALGQNPLDSSNPLRLTQVITGGEPDFATFTLPISYNTLTNNLGVLQLRVDGESAKLQDFVRATNGNCLLVWNTTYEPPGQRYLQPQLIFEGETDETIVRSGLGKLATFDSVNMVQFFETCSAFSDNGTTIYAQTPMCPDAEYVIELRTPTGDHIKSFTNSTSTGVISEFWDLTYEDGVTPYTGDAVDAVFKVTLLDPGNGTNVQRLNKTYGVIEGNFDVAYAYNPSPELAKDGSWWNQMTAVVDKLLAPRNGFDQVYNSTFNWYWEAFNPGYPGYLNDRPKALSLLTNLTAADTKNFFFYGHGSSTSLGDGTTNANRPYLSVWEVGQKLTNSWSTNGIVAKHPYRFVFLDGCETAKTMNWPHAFGVYDPGPPGLPQTSIGRQAFLGWDAEVGGIRDTNNLIIPDLANAYGTTLNLFYTYWMSKAQVWACISAASSTNLAMPLPVKGNEIYTVNNVRHRRPTANLKLIGYRDLTR